MCTPTVHCGPVWPGPEWKNKSKRPARLERKGGEVMAYFSNGSEGDGAREQYCDRCQNWRDRGDGRGDGCPVWDLHMAWNYDAVGKDADETKRLALDVLWPRLKVFNGDCQLFLEKALKQPTRKENEHGKSNPSNTN